MGRIRGAVELNENATTFLRGDGEWAVPPGGSGSGDVVGPASAVDSRFAAFDGTTGKLIKDSGSAAGSFATASHNHDAQYAALAHDHNSLYSPLGHNHDLAYAALAHNHDAAYAALSHTHAASAIASGTIATSRLGGGTANSSTFLRGDQVWAAPPGGGGGADVFVCVAGSGGDGVLDPGFGTICLQFK